MKKFFVLFAACALVAAFTLPAMAESEWSFYGSSRFSTWSEDWDNNSMTQYMGRATTFDDRDLTWDQDGGSRFGANVAAGDISGRYEVGINDDGINQRLIWGQWDFGAGQIRIGTDYSPSELFNYSDQRWWGYNCLTSMGYFYAGRSAQIKFTFPAAGGTFQFAFVEPDTTAIAIGANAIEQDTSIPKLEASFTRNFGPVYFFVSGGYNTYDDVVIATDKEYDVDSWMIGTCLGIAQGPFYAYGAIFTAQNLVEYASAFGFDFELNAVYDGVSDSIEDTDTVSYSLVAGFSPNDMITLEAGWGYAEMDRTVQGVTTEDDAQMYYLQCRIQVAEGFSIVPEIGKYDLKDRTVGGVSTDQGDMNYFGAHWKIDF